MLLAELPPLLIMVNLTVSLSPGLSSNPLGFTISNSGAKMFMSNLLSHVSVPSVQLTKNLTLVLLGTLSHTVKAKASSKVISEFAETFPTL